MPFQRGQSGNAGGRPKGSSNKDAERLRSLISSFLEKQFKAVTLEFQKLEGRDKVKAFTDLLQYALPKLQAVSDGVKFEQLNDEQLNQIIKHLTEDA